MKSNQRFLIILFVILLTTACLFLNVEHRGNEILNSIPIYEDAEFIQESRTTYPDNTPSIIRTYQADASKDELLSYYKSNLIDLGWDVQFWNNPDPLVPWEILAQKDGWQLHFLFHSSGQFFIEIYLK